MKPLFPWGWIYIPSMFAKVTDSFLASCWDLRLLDWCWISPHVDTGWFTQCKILLLPWGTISNTRAGGIPHSFQWDSMNLVVLSSSEYSVVLWFPFHPWVHRAPDASPEWVIKPLCAALTQLFPSRGSLEPCHSMEGSCCSTEDGKWKWKTWYQSRNLELANKPLLSASGADTWANTACFFKYLNIYLNFDR